MAWYCAMWHPDRLKTMTSLATPHPTAFARSLLTSTQLLHSWYFLFYQLPRLPEWSATSAFGRALILDSTPLITCAPRANTATRARAVCGARRRMPRRSRHHLLEPGLNAELDFKTLNGGVYADFDLTPRPAAADGAANINGKFVYRRNRTTTGRAGTGGPLLTFKGLNGSIRLHSKPI